MTRISRCTRLRLTASPRSQSHWVSRRLPRNGWAVYSWSISRIRRRLSAVSAAGSWYRLERLRPSNSHCLRTLNCGWSASTRGRSRSGDRSDFFFEPLQLHFEPADLLEQFGLLGLGAGRGRLAAVAEDLVGPGEQLLLPGVDQGRVDPVLAGQLVDGPVSLEGGQGHLGLERRRVLFPLTCHLIPFPGPPQC